MTIVTEDLTKSIIDAGVGTVFGLDFPNVATAVSRAVVAWLPVQKNVTAQGNAVGTAGVGTASGKMFLAGGAGAIITGTLQAAGINGILAPSLGSAVGNGILRTFNTSWQYSGTVAAVGTGVDTTSILFTDPAALIALLNGNLPGATLSGILVPKLSTGLGNGIANVISGGFGLGGVTGSASPSGATGVSISVTF